MKIRTIFPIVLLSLVVAFCPTFAANQANAALSHSTGVDWYNVRSKPEVTVGDAGYTTFAAAVTALGNAQATLVVPAGIHAGGGITVPRTLSLRVLKGAIIKVAERTTLTINGPLEAGLYQIFACARTGRVVLAPGKTKEIFPQWWGAQGDGVTNDAAAFNAMFAAAGKNMLVTIPATDSFYYLGTTTIVLPKIVDIFSNHAVLKWGAVPGACFKFNYDFVTAGNYYWGNKRIIGLTFQTTDKNTTLVWAPYGIKYVTFESCAWIGAWNAKDGARTSGVGLRIDGRFGTRENWTSDQLALRDCHFRNLDTLVFLIGDTQGRPRTGIDAFMDAKLFENCYFEYFRRGVVMEYCHGILFQRCMIMPSSYAFVPKRREDGGFRLDLKECANITVISSYWENVGKPDIDNAKIRLDCQYSPKYTLAPITIINCDGINSAKMNDTTLTMPPVYDVQMLSGVKPPGIINKKYRVNFIDGFGALINNSVASQNIIVGPNRNMVLHSAIAGNTMGNSAVTTNWDPYTNKALTDDHMITMEFCSQGSNLGNNFISIRQQKPGAGMAPSWAHNGGMPTYGKEIARISADGTITAKKFKLGAVQILSGAGSPEGAVAGNPGDLYLNPDGGVGASFYVKESGPGSTGWRALAATNGITTNSRGLVTIPVSACGMTYVATAAVTYKLPAGDLSGHVAAGRPPLQYTFVKSGAGALAIDPGTGNFIALGGPGKKLTNSVARETNNFVTLRLIRSAAGVNTWTITGAFGSWVSIPQEAAERP